MSKDILRDLRGFGTVEKWVLTDPKINIHAKAIYSLLCAYAGGKDSAFPSVDTLTVQLNISKDTIYKYIKELREKGVIEVEQIREGGRFSRNIYTLLNYNPNMISAESGSTGHGTTVADTTVADQVDPNINRAKNNRTKSNSNKHTSSSTDDRSIYSEAFERWWAIYPRKQSKGRAWKTWKQDKLDKRVDELVEKLQQQVAIQYSQTETQYIPHPSTYLNECRYDDEVEQIKGGSNGITANSNNHVPRGIQAQREYQQQAQAAYESGILDGFEGPL